MICPLMMIGINVHPEKHFRSSNHTGPKECEKIAECVGSECAWWVQGRDSGCSMKLIAKAQGLKTHG